MTRSISKAKRWAQQPNSWSGRDIYEHAVFGVNDTGTFSDSPAPTHKGLAELEVVKARLRASKISHRTMIGATSNVFCMTRQIVVREQDMRKASEAITDNEVEEMNYLYRLNS